jgi:Spy/CpxP family protein refolding chaperone
MGEGMPGCGMKGGMGEGMPGCGMKGGMGEGTPGCGMKGGMGKGMPGCRMNGEMGRGMEGGPMRGPGMGPGMGAGNGRMMLQGLDLTAEQQKKLADIRERQERLAVQAQADLRLATMDLQKLMRADTPDQAKIDAQIDRVAQLRAQMQKSRTATLLEVRAMLTPEQLKKWYEATMGDEEEAD